MKDARFDITRRHLLIVPELRRQKNYWDYIARLSVNPQAVEIAKANARILQGWLDYRAWHARYQIELAAHRLQFRKAA